MPSLLPRALVPGVLRVLRGTWRQLVAVDLLAKAAGVLVVTPTTALLLRVSGGSAFGDVPFGGYQVYGGRSTLRGYAMGKYRGKHLVAGQAEFRWTFYRRLGAVAFAGVGTVWGGESQSEEDVFERGLLPSVGAGIRYTLSKEKRINARIDYAFGVNGNDGLYLGIMEAF
ncbi:MAG: BamA/TamA family outer membrane protein [Gemmatimonadales bacterium]|nr:BamA/TamA family outer membrane protein [Gemmatimonadales bacterium]